MCGGAPSLLLKLTHGIIQAMKCRTIYSRHRLIRLKYMGVHLYWEKRAKCQGWLILGVEMQPTALSKVKAMIRTEKL